MRDATNAVMLAREEIKRRFYFYDLEMDEWELSVKVLIYSNL